MTGQNIADGANVLTTAIVRAFERKEYLDRMEQEKKERAEKIELNKKRYAAEAAARIQGIDLRERGMGQRDEEIKIRTDREKRLQEQGEDRARIEKAKYADIKEKTRRNTKDSSLKDMKVLLDSYDKDIQDLSRNIVASKWDAVAKEGYMQEQTTKRMKKDALQEVYEEKMYQQNSSGGDLPKDVPDVKEKEEEHKSGMSGTEEMIDTARETAKEGRYKTAEGKVKTLLKQGLISKDKYKALKAEFKILSKKR